MEGPMATNPPGRLTAEIEFYETQKAEWLKNHRDDYVVVKGNNVIGFFKNFHEAYRAGYEKFGASVDFLVKRIAVQEPVFVVF